MTTQLDVSIGAAKESTYGTAVTPTKFVEFTDEDLDLDITNTQGQGLRVGSRVNRLSRRAPSKYSAAGGFTTEACAKGIGWIFEAVLGGVNSTQRASTGVYQHNFIMATTDPLPSWTIQKGIPPHGGGTTLAHTFTGMVGNTLEINSPNSDIVTIKPSFAGKTMVTNVSYAAPSYPSETGQEIFTFVGGSIVLATSTTGPTTTALATGTAVANILDFSCTIDNQLDDGGYTFGSGGTRGRRPLLGRGMISGSVTAEFDAATLRDAYINQTTLGLIWTVVGRGTIGTGSDNPALSIHIPAIKLDGEVPKSNGGAPVTLSIPFVGLDNGTNSPITVSWVSTDTTP